MKVLRDGYGKLDALAFHNRRSHYTEVPFKLMSGLFKETDWGCVIGLNHGAEVECPHPEPEVNAAYKKWREATGVQS